MNKTKIINHYLIITIGTFVAALSINLFLKPNQIVAGGVSGIATVLNALLNIPMGIVMIVIDIPLFILGIIKNGKAFGFKTIYSSLIFAVFVDITAKIPVVTTDKLLASIYGGAMMGFGLAIVFRMGSSSGGSDLAAQLISNAVKKISVSQALAIIDGIIIIFSAIVFKNLDIMFYAILAILISSKLIQLIHEGINYAKAVYIISSKSDAIANDIINELHRGVTSLYGKGNYSKKDINILLCVIKTYELQKLKKIAKKHDENSFIILTDTKEVYGEGFN